MESINLNGSFSLAQTMECGQCFRWEALEDGTYTGVVSGVVYRLRQNHDTLQCAFSKGGSTEFISKYLDLDRDYDAIRRAVSINEYMKTVSDFGYGIRILRQEPWEALCSFIISQCNNIPRIKSIISRLCVALGEEISFEREKYFSFPSAEKIARLEVSDLDFLRSGYRAPYIIGAARAVFEGKLDLESLRDMNTSEGKE
ncbi:MAG: DNA-3-methyladenine glycosylase 2 family protein, partial [Clostridiales bacterium]|nr:DNA-3-methyladenine glycosylase 2 family protein [Clostridiales bacterium]